MDKSTTLTLEQVKAILVPFYKLFNKPNAATIAEHIKTILPAEWKSYADDHHWKSRDDFMKTTSFIAQTLPDLTWQVKEMLISGDRVTVRSQISAMPKGSFFGYPTENKSFSVMAIDIHTIENGKPIVAYHIEDWHNALMQLKAV